jgi:hypothetical protein
VLTIIAIAISLMVWWYRPIKVKRQKPIGEQITLNDLFGGE